MAVWYRASKDNHIQKVFSGDGGLFVAGRWNHQGQKVIYCSESIALCTLEWLSHNGLSVSGFDYHRFSIEIPDELLRKFTAKDLFKNWNAAPATMVGRDFVDENLFSQSKYLGLILPSVMVPEEYNVIINPLHERFAEVVTSTQYLGKHIAPDR